MKAVILDIGGVLEICPATGWAATWENRLGLPAGEINDRCADVWAAGSVGEITEPEVRQQVAKHLSLTSQQLEAFMAGLQTRPQDCLLLDDHPPNIEAAQAFGMHATLYTGTATATAAVEQFLGA